VTNPGTRVDDIHNNKDADTAVALGALNGYALKVGRNFSSQKAGSDGKLYLTLNDTIFDKPVRTQDLRRGTTSI
jgi:hypothetical protein